MQSPILWVQLLSDDDWGCGGGVRIQIYIYPIPIVLVPQHLWCKILLPDEDILQISVFHSTRFQNLQGAIGLSFQLLIRRL